MTELKKIDKTATVKQSNNLTVARYTLSLMEQRLMFAICSQINKNSTNFERIRFSVNDLADLCNINGDRKYDDIKRVSVKLLKRIVTIPTADGGEYVTHWLQSQRYYPSDSSIEFKIDDDLKGELLQLKKAYIDTPVSMLTGFKKKYSSRMYLILKKMLKIGDFEYKLDFFREKFQLAATYQKFSNIKNGVLEPALAELNETSDLDIKHEYVKEGRFFTKIHFTIKLKDKGRNLITHETNKFKEHENNILDDTAYDDDQQKIYDSLISRGISTNKANSLVKKYNVSLLERNLQYAVKQKDTSINLPGLIISFIEQDIAGQNLKAKQKANEREKQRQLDRLQAYEMFHGKAIDEAPEETNEPTTSDLENELAEIEAELICRKGEQAGARLLNKIKSLGLSIEDVKAGKRK